MAKKKLLFWDSLFAFIIVTYVGFDRFLVVYGDYCDFTKSLSIRLMTNRHYVT